MSESLSRRELTLNDVSCDRGDVSIERHYQAGPFATASVVDENARAAGHPKFVRTVNSLAIFPSMAG
jgi:hypothetical protein